ncbi:MAG: hypothetical protein ACKVT0_22620, partial [Planctomycetaceae bacterium]
MTEAYTGKKSKDMQAAASHLTRLWPSFGKALRAFLVAIFGGIFFLALPARHAISADEPRVIFADDFEAHGEGETLGNVKPKVGGAYVDTGSTTIVAIESLAGVESPATAGKLCARCNKNSAWCQLSDADVVAVKNQIVRFRFDILLTDKGFGGADIQTFMGSDPESSRAFNLLLDTNGSIAYYAAGESRSITGKVPVGQWASVDLIADYKKRIFKAKIGDVSFVGRFDKKSFDFSTFYMGEFGDPIYYFDNLLVELAPQLAKELDGVAAQIELTDA